MTALFAFRPGGPATALTIEEAAAAAGGWAWAEGRLYELIGRWASTCAGPEAKAYLDICSQHHAWRASAWAGELGGRLVQAYGGPGPSPEEATKPFSASSEALLGALAGLDGDIERAAAYNRVVMARAVSEYRWWQGRLSPAADMALARTLGMALADASADWADGASVLCALIDAGPDDAPDRAAAACARVEHTLARGELVFGG